MEEFRNIEEFISTRNTKNIFISNFGRIKRVNNKNIEKIVLGSNDGSGYKQININGKTIKVHHLVLNYFVGECPNGLERDHLNRVRSDNRLCNLRYVSKSDNLKNRGVYKSKKKKGCISQRGNKWRFIYRINKQIKTKTFKTEIEAKIAQAFYQGAINIIEKY